MIKFLGNKIVIVGATLVLVSIVPWLLGNPLYLYPFGTLVLGAGTIAAGLFMEFVRDK